MNLFLKEVKCLEIYLVIQMLNIIFDDPVLFIR